ncbi:MAG: YbdK family carboxylate-amine ligase [Thiomonas delicata]|jgi:carboxylate-amine ligase|uniref:YbdK family carboxylate-amine ligase n=1 Tax=Thiomonas sp. TaxID=2047785 RepID=UPI00258EF5C8|nr:YbdK family carboxylate-amine ligase [Thiomonas sp.]
MNLGTFKESAALSLGIELELQIVSRHNYDLMPSAPDLLRLLEGRKLPGLVTPEMTESMIELSTGICTGYDDALAQLGEIQAALVEAANKLDVGLAGGGTHPFQHWAQQRIFDKPRFLQLSELYGYLSKQFTVFGQHVHLGCASSDEALYTLHCISRYIPHFIALSASSPYVQGEDTGFHSARLNSVFAFPLSGRAPFVLDWADFETYFGKMTATGVVKSMKDFYWDIRPKPEYGTIEVRVMDTPLTIPKAARIAAYIQTLGRWIQTERPFAPQEDDYLVYTFNRFQACRFGFDGTFVDPATREHRTLREDLVRTLVKLEDHAIALRSDPALRELLTDVTGRGNDAQWIRETFAREGHLPEVVRQQCERWMGRMPRNPAPGDTPST